MKKLRRGYVGALFALVGLLPVIAGCSDSNNGSGGSGGGGTGPPAVPALVGSWLSTSLVAGGVDASTQGMTLNFTFTNTSQYSMAVTGDLLGFCTPGPNCTDNGDFSSTSTQLTFDPGTVDATTLNYAIVGTVLTVLGTIDGTSVTFTFTKM